MPNAILLAGIPAENASLFHRLPMAVGDPAAWIRIDQEIMVIARDIEVARIRQHVDATAVACPQDYCPDKGLDPDRATATAQSVAEFLRRRSVDRVTVDRTLPFIFAWHIRQVGIAIEYDAALGVIDRRTKTPRELECLQAAQTTTEQAMRMACEIIANSTADTNGQLIHQGEVLTSQRLKAIIAQFLLDRNFTMGHGAIVATVPDVADCHHGGEGPLMTQHPVVVDIFPRDESTRFWGDCTRTVVHGQPSDQVLKMHRAVVAAKAAATAALQVGSTGDAVHQAATSVLREHGFPLSRGQITDHPSIQHGTGHGIGLEIHEPILLDDHGPEILAGEVLTIEPGLYGRIDGGVRVEDMVVATVEGPLNFNQLHEGLDWT